MKSPFWLLALSLALAQAPTSADTVKDREGAVRQDKARLEKDERWHYNDVRLGFAEAKRTGKPLLVVLRCVPCLSCSGIDAQVLLQDSDVTPLLDEFICVRVINANALDLSLFQFDYDLSFSALFFNGDGTVYGRYGSWTHQKNAQDKTTAGFKRALEAALALHGGYPANKAALAGKQGVAMPFKTPVEIPTLSGKYRIELDWNGKVVPSCVHCHQIGDALRLWHRNKNRTVPADLIYSWPAPETIGLTLAPDEVARVESVAAGSAAAAAGLQPGDDLLSLAGQPLISIADVSWVLHRTADPGPLALVVHRGEDLKSVTLDLASRWQTKADISGRVGTWGLRGMATGGMVVEDLKDDERTRRGLDRDHLALWIKYLGEYGKHGAAKRAGFQKEDVLVEIEGLSRRMTEGELIDHLLNKHAVGDKVKVAVLREGKKVELELPVQ